MKRINRVFVEVITTVGILSSGFLLGDAVYRSNSLGLLIRAMVLWVVWIAFAVWRGLEE